MVIIRGVVPDITEFEAAPSVLCRIDVAFEIRDGPESGVVVSKGTQIEMICSPRNGQ